MKYSVEVSKSAARSLRKITPQIRHQIYAALKELEHTPRPVGVRKVVGAEDTWRIRVGNYRVVYTIKDNKLLVVVVRVGHRREVYRNL